MLYKKDPEKKQDLVTSPVETGKATTRDESVRQVELRRLLYERIARGNALAEAEEQAHRRWYAT